MRDQKSHTFFTGAFVGILMGLLLAPKENISKEKELKNSFEDFLDSIKEIDIEEIKNSFINRLTQIEDTLEEMPNDKKITFIENKLEKIIDGCTKIIEIAKEKNMLKAVDAADSISTKAKEILKHINNFDKEEKKVEEKTTPKPKKKKITAVKKAQIKKKSKTSK